MCWHSASRKAPVSALCSATSASGGCMAAVRPVEPSAWSNWCKGVRAASVCWSWRARAAYVFAFIKVVGAGQRTGLAKRRSHHRQGNRLNGSKNLILGFCSGQPFRLLSPFIASLRHTTFAGDVCFLIEDMTAEDIDRLRACGIRVERTTRSAQPRMTSMASRFFSFLDFLVHHGRAYGTVMLVDPTDIVFQTDPFAVPLPADIVYTGERRVIGGSGPDHDAVVQAYGVSTADNIRDCQLSNPGLTVGTLPGILRYLTMMTHELASLATPIGGAIDRGVHNHVVRMHPLRFAWCDTGEQLAVSVQGVPHAAVGVSEQGVLINGRKPPALIGWSENLRTMAYVHVSPSCRLDDSMRGAFPAADFPAPPIRGLSPAGDAIIAFYHRERDADWLALFLGSLRCVMDRIRLHCVGDFDQQAERILVDAGCTLTRILPMQLEMVESLAHFHLNQALEALAADPAQRPAQVLILDNMRTVFMRDPFDSKTIGLSLFAEGSHRIADSDDQRKRLACFVPEQSSRLPLPVVSSALLRGPLPVVQEFYRSMLAELAGHEDTFSITRLVQGVFNKLSYFGGLRFPVIVHPNGAEAYFDRRDEPVLSIDTRHGVRINGAAPSVVLAEHPETPLMISLRAELGLSRN
jgi:hypothetical protein